MERLTEAVAEGGHQKDIDERVGDRVERCKQHADLLHRGVLHVDDDTNRPEHVVDGVITDGKDEDGSDGNTSLCHERIRGVNGIGTCHGLRFESLTQRH